MRAAASLLLMAAACVPAIPSIEGKACDDDHPCGEGYVCSDAPCQRRGKQVLTNADFEQGPGLPGWGASGNSVVEAQQARVRSGAWAARCSVKGANTSSYFGLNSQRAPGVALDAGTTWCAAVWVDRGTVPPEEPVRFHIRMLDARNDFTDDAVTVPFADAGWQRALVTKVVEAPYNAGLSVRISVDDFDGGEYFADDAEVWQDVPGGVCVASP